MALGNNLNGEKNSDKLSKSESQTDDIQSINSDEISALKKRIEELEAEKEQIQREVEARMLSVDQACIVSEVDLKGIITYVNDKHCEVSQYSREELIGANQNIVRHPDMPKEVFKEMWSTIGKGKIFRGLVKNRKKDGTPYYVDGIFTPVLGPNGKPIKYIGIRYDISQQTYEKLAAEGVVKAIDASFASAEYDTKGNIINANSNFLNSMEYTLEDLQGKNHKIIADSQFVNGSDYNRFWSDLASGTVKSDLYKFVSRSGSDVYLQSVFSAVRDDMNRIVKIIQIASDITKATENATQLNREIEARAASVDQACIVSETDLKGYITYVNDKHCEVSQYSREELIGSNQNIVRHPDMKKEVFKEMWATIGRGKIFRGFVKNRKKDGSPYYVDGIFTPVLGPNGKPIKYIGIRFDITDTVIEQQRMKGIVDAIDTSYAFTEFDTKGNVIIANQNFLTLMEYSMDDIRGRHHRMFVDKAYSNTSEYARFWEDLAAGKEQIDQYKQIARSGKEVWLQSVFSPVKDEMGRIIKIVNVSTDISSQKNVLFDVQKIVDIAGKEGNLNERIPTKNVDSKLIELVEGVNNLMDILSKPIGVVQELAHMVASSAEEMMAKGDQMQRNTQEMASAIQQMAEGAQQQAQQTDEVSKLVDGVLKAAGEMSSKSEIINKAAERGQESSNSGLITIKKVVENMNEIQESAKSTSDSIVVLTQRAEDIANTLNVITDIASQTNLLALNAAIEAARAGDAGRGFAVVAEEIRKLAEDSRKSAIDIAKVIREVQKDVTSASKAIDSMDHSVKSGNSASKEAESVFESISISSNETLVLSKEILNATGLQKEAMTNTVKSIEKIVVVSEETAAGTEQIATSSKELSGGMTEVGATSKDLADVANQLLESVAKFKVDKK